MKIPHCACLNLFSGLNSSLIMRPVIDRPCTPKCPGSYGILPSMQCVICKAMYHAKCQGLISPNLRVFKCKRCLTRRQPLQPRAQLPSAGSEGATVKLKLPMIPKVSDYKCTMLQKLSKCEVKAWLFWNLIILPSLIHPWTLVIYQGLIYLLIEVKLAA